MIEGKSNITLKRITQVCHDLKTWQYHNRQAGRQAGRVLGSLSPADVCTHEQTARS